LLKPVPRSPRTARAGAENRMAKVTYIESNGTRHEVEVGNGLSVMQGAVNNDIPGIVAECGGACSCATCHVHLEPHWYAKLGAPEDMEKDMLDFVVDMKETSRLSCQIKVTPELDGLIVHIPESQF
jgi:2Fe-2S ferredoxin